MFQSATRDILILPLGPHGVSGSYTESLYVGDCVELGISFTPSGAIVDGSWVYSPLELQILDTNNGNGLAQFFYYPVDGSIKYFSIGRGFPDPYNVCFGDYVNVSVTRASGDTSTLEFSLTVKGK